MEEDSEPTPRLRSGCGYYLVLTAVGCILLLVNGFLVQTGLSAYQEYGPRELTEPKAQQAIQVVVPVALIFMEYWLYDWSLDHFSTGAE